MDFDCTKGNIEYDFIDELDPASDDAEFQAQFWQQVHRVAFSNS